MELKFFKNNKHIFSIYIDESVNSPFRSINVSETFFSIYDILGKYSNQLKNVFKHWYDLAEKTFKKKSDLIFYSNSHRFLLLLFKNEYNQYLDRISFNFDFVKNNNDVNEEYLSENFILIAKQNSNSKRKILEYTILEITPTKDDYAILLSFLVTNVFFRFSLRCVELYSILEENLITNIHLKKWIELGDNKNYIYENIIKYQDLIYDTILDTFYQHYSSFEFFKNVGSLLLNNGGSKVNELVLKNLILVEDVIYKKMRQYMFNFYEKYYSNEDVNIPFGLEKYLILLDKILNKKSKF